MWQAAHRALAPPRWASRAEIVGDHFEIGTGLPGKSKKVRWSSNRRHRFGRSKSVYSPSLIKLAPTFFESIDEHFSLAQQVDAGVDRFAPILKKTRGYRVLDESFVVSRNVCVHTLHLSRLVT
jgi:hypothetical protein